jgi:hypothetical protein
MSQQGATYAAFIQSELDREHERRGSVNSRAATAITSATGLVTLTLAAVAVIKGESTLLHGAAEAWLVVGVAALLVAAILAVLSGVNWRYHVTTAETLAEMRTTHWGDSEVTASNVVAHCNILTVTSLRAGTNVKMTLLLSAYGVQVLAIAALAVAFISIVE